MKIGGCPLVCIILRWVPLSPPKVMLSWHYAVPESSYFQESCSGRLHRRQSLRTLSVQQKSLLIDTLLKEENAAQCRPCLPHQMLKPAQCCVSPSSCWFSLLCFSIHPSFLRRRHYDRAHSLHLGLLFFQLDSTGWLFPLQPSAGFSPPPTSFFVMW